MEGREKVDDTRPYPPSDAGKGKQNLPPSYGRDEKWVREYEEQFGEEPSFF